MLALDRGCVTLCGDRQTFLVENLHTPGTRGGPGGRDRTLAVKRKKTLENQFFSRKKNK